MFLVLGKIVCLQQFDLSFVLCLLQICNFKVDRVQYVDLETKNGSDV